MKAVAPPPQLCISFALPQEYAPFRRYLGRAAGRERALPVTVRAGYSGTGMMHAQRHVAELLSATAQSPDFLLVCGFAGALGSLPCQAGDIVIAERVVDCARQNGANTEYCADSRLLAAAGSVRSLDAPTHVCTLATTDRVLLDGGEKRAFLDRCPQAQCVDMETAGALQVATERGIPWLAVRAVTDGPDDAMPFDFNALGDVNGNVSLARVVVAALTHPRKIPSLIQLGRRSSLAADNLTRFLVEMLPLIPAIVGQS